MSEHRLDYLEQLETESIHIFREIAGQFERPVLLFRWIAANAPRAIMLFVQKIAVERSFWVSNCMVLE